MAGPAVVGSPTTIRAVRRVLIKSCATTVIFLVIVEALVAQHRYVAVFNPVRTAADRIALLRQFWPRLPEDRSNREVRRRDDRNRNDSLTNHHCRACQSRQRGREQRYT